MLRQFHSRDLNLKVLFATVVVILAIVGAVFAFLTPWKKGLLRRYEAIATITQNPDKFVDREVRVRGKIEQALFIPTLYVSFLLIGDETGEIWYREGGEVAANVSRGDIVALQGVIQREFIIPSVGVSKVAIVKCDRIEDITRYPSDFEAREVLVRGIVKQVLFSPSINAAFLLIEDESGEIWARVPELMAKEGKKVIIEGSIQRELSVPGKETEPVGIIGYDEIAWILENPAGFTAREVLIKGEVQQRISIPLIRFTFLRVRDPTGEIWCRTEQEEVKEGDIVMVKGDIYTGFRFQDKYYGVMLIETQ
jgi:hypothetical protein